MKKEKFSLLLWPLISLLLFAALILVERNGIQYGVQAYNEDFIPPEVMQAEKSAQEKECVIVYDSQELKSEDYCNSIAFVLDSMRVGYDAVDLASREFPSLAPYKTVIVSLADLDRMQTATFGLLDWVERGGRVLFALPPQPTSTLEVISNKMGILYSDLDYSFQNNIRFETDLMPGAKGKEFSWGENNRSGLSVQLNKDCIVHMVALGASEIPMLWECAYGEGKIVVNNNDAFIEKESRGLVAAAYSLLEDACAYPVINASLFFIDDFPSPIPEGNNEWIYKQYKRDIGSFYTNIWYPSLMRFADKYGISYTGLIIETYGDDTSPPFAPLDKVERFKYFGGLLLEEGNEMGLHGYNHQPLVLQNFDYQGLLHYNKWNSLDDMESAISEAIRFSKQLFPGTELKTYVPPSNILSDEGRQLLKERFPQINTISGIYLNEHYAFEQEFDISEDGIINLPRLIAGCDLDNYMYYVALNEISFHYVNSHFLHPDDVLDPARGALKGWAALEQEFGKYLDWLYGSAKGLRNLTAQEGAMAVQRYCNLTVKRTLEDKKLTLDLDGFYDEAWLMVRLNEGTPGFVQGGSIVPVCGDLYLLHAIENQVVITIER